MLLKINILLNNRRGTKNEFLMQKLMEAIEQETDITLEHSTEAEKDIQNSINYYYNNQSQIEQRLYELDEEWDIEDVLQVEGAALTFTGVILGLTVHKKWLALPLIATAILVAGLLKKGVRPTPLLRRLGLRTRAEIDKEKYALKAIRGDFKYLLDVPNSVWNAVNL